MTTEKFATSASIAVRIKEMGKTTLLETGIACRVSGILPGACAPELLTIFPGTTCRQMADTVTMAWAGMIDRPTLTAALQACLYQVADITAAVQQAISLSFQQNALYSNNGSMNKALAFYQGDLTHMTTDETVDYLVISTRPNDYTPTPGSMIGALASVGVSVAQLAQNKAADYRPSNYCWVSQAITGQAFKRIICFEPMQGSSGAPGQVPGIFSSLTQFAGTSAQYISVATSMVSTGSLGADPSAILTALFNGAKGVLTTTFLMMAFKIVNYNSSWTATLNTVFTQLKA
jgi:hypothetical protein